MASADPMAVVLNPARSWLYGAVGLAYAQFGEGDAEEASPRRRTGSPTRSTDKDLAMMRMVPSPEAMMGTAVEPRQRVIQVCAGGEHGVLLTDAAIAFTWGDNRYGQLGRAPCFKEESGRPFPVIDLLGEEVLQVAAGTHHCLALVVPGLVWAWGRNKAGQLGCGDTRDKVSPTRVCHEPVGKKSSKEQLGEGSEKDSFIICIGAGGNNSIAAAANATVWQWGDIVNKSLAKGDTRDSTRAERMAPLSSMGAAVEVKAGVNRPHKVTGKDGFKPTARKGVRKRPGRPAISISETACKVLLEVGDVVPPEAREERVRHQVEAIRLLQEAINRERKALMANDANRDTEEAGGAESAVADLGELQETLAMLQRDVLIADREIERLEKALESAELHQEHTRRQLNQLGQHGAKLLETQDQLMLQMFEVKGPDKKKLEERLADVRRFVEANQSARESLTEQQQQTNAEKTRVSEDLKMQRSEKAKQKQKLQTLASLQKSVLEATNASDSMVVFLEDRVREFGARFEHRRHEGDFLSAMREFEADENFLRGVEASVRDLGALDSSETVRIRRAQLVSALLQDLVGLRRSWNNLLQDHWSRDSLDLSCFFETHKARPGAQKEEPASWMRLGRGTASQER